MFSRRKKIAAGSFGAALLVLFGVSGAMAAASPPSVGGPEAYIAGGEPVTDPGPAVAIYANTLDKFRCGGTLIAEAAVVTAAHCVSDLPTEQDTAQTPPQTSERFFIRAGSSNRTAGQVREVSSVHLHPGWSWQRAGADDIAVLGLAAPVPGVEPATLDHVEPDQPVHVTGWGHARPQLLPPPFPAPAIPTRLSGIDMRVVDCREGLEALTLDPGPHEVCMTSTTLLTGPCPGDSGSAAVQGRDVVALVSRGFEPCGLGVGGVVMTSLGPHAEWVQKTAALV